MTIYLMLNGDRAMHDEPELAGLEEEDRPSQSSPDANPQSMLKCPKCGANIEKSWICFQCQVKDQTYYMGGDMNHKCIKCGFDKHPFIPNSELLCDA